MSVDLTLAPYEVTTVRVPHSTSNELWTALAGRVGPEMVSRPMVYWGLPMWSTD